MSLWTLCLQCSPSGISVGDFEPGRGESDPRDSRALSAGPLGSFSTLHLHSSLRVSDKRRVSLKLAETTTARCVRKDYNFDPHLVP